MLLSNILNMTRTMSCFQKNTSTVKESDYKRRKAFLEMTASVLNHCYGSMRDELKQKFNKDFPTNVMYVNFNDFQKQNYELLENVFESLSPPQCNQTDLKMVKEDEWTEVDNDRHITYHDFISLYAQGWLTSSMIDTI